MCISEVESGTREVMKDKFYFHCKFKKSYLSVKQSVLNGSFEIWYLWTFELAAQMDCAHVLICIWWNLSAVFFVWTSMFVLRSVKWALLSDMDFADMAAATSSLLTYSDTSGITNVSILSHILFWVHLCLLLVLICQKCRYFILIWCSCVWNGNLYW